MYRATIVEPLSLGELQSFARQYSYHNAHEDPAYNVVQEAEQEPTFNGMLD